MMTLPTGLRMIGSTSSQVSAPMFRSDCLGMLQEENVVFTAQPTCLDQYLLQLLELRANSRNCHRVIVAGIFAQSDIITDPVDQLVNEL